GNGFWFALVCLPIPKATQRDTSPIFLLHLVGSAPPNPAIDLNGFQSCAPAARLAIQGEKT
ncbi:MAG: hypothetical protein PS018_28095, partial [bacterium]|nr:hypothetical protein [bacterium]